MSTLYDTLGVSKSASGDEIKKAYRKLAREYHPDRNPGDAAAEEKFKEVQHAYDVLSDDDKRKQYDRLGTQNGRAGAGAGPQNVNFDFGDFNVGDLGDIFGGLFGGGGGGRGPPAQRRQPVRGADAEAPGPLPFQAPLRRAGPKAPGELTVARPRGGGPG